jgi:hypothetical protein
VDQLGRRYSVATGTQKTPGVRLTVEQQRQRRVAVLAAGERGDGLVRLLVLFPHGQLAKERRFTEDETLDLMPLQPGLGHQVCHFARMDARREPNARTCAIFVAHFNHSL